MRDSSVIAPTYAESMDAETKALVRRIAIGMALVVAEGCTFFAVVVTFAP
jgi:hypothetical protein